MGNIGVFIELKDGAIKKTNFELLTLAQQANRDVSAVIFASDVQPFQAALQEYGVKEIIQVTGLTDLNYNADIFANSLHQLIKAHDFADFLGANSAMGKDLLPRIAAKFESAIAVDCTAIDLNESTATRPMYAGKVIAEVKLTGEPRFYSLRPNVISAETVAGAPAPEIKLFNAVEETPLLKVKEVVQSISQKIELTEAEVIIAGGRGMKSKENFAILEDLAQVLNAAVAASRAAVDAEYATLDIQVGQTGKTVNPKLYIACGISGAIQHLAGMKTSKTIVAINKDPEAPIFQMADYGIVGDLFEIVPLLKDELVKQISQK